MALLRDPFVVVAQSGKVERVERMKLPLCRSCTVEPTTTTKGRDACYQTGHDDACPDDEFSLFKSGAIETGFRVWSCLLCLKLFL